MVDISTIEHVRVNPNIPKNKGSGPDTLFFSKNFISLQIHYIRQILKFRNMIFFIKLLL